MAFERRIEHLRYRYGICLNDECPCCKDKSVLQIVARKEFVCPECGKPLREVAPPKQPSYKWVKWLIVAALLACAGICYYHFFGNTEEKLIEPSQDEVATDTLEETVPITDRPPLTPPQGEDGVPTTEEDQANDGVFPATAEDESAVYRTKVTEPRENAATVGAESSSKSSRLRSKESVGVASPHPVGESEGGGPHLSWGVYSGPANGLGGTIRVTAAHVLDCRDGSSIQLQPGDEIQQTKFQGDDLRQGVWISNGERQFFTR